MPASEFTFDWHIDWSEFDTLRDVAEIESGIFVISKNKIPFWFEAALCNREIGNPDFQVKIVCRLRGGYKSVVFKYTVAMRMSEGHFFKMPIDKWSFPGTCNKSKFQELAGFTDADPLIFRYTITIDDEFFAGVFCEFPELKPAPQCMIKLFEKIQNHPKADEYLSQLSDIKLLSSDGAEFYGHRNILATQSETLTTLFSHSADEGNEEKIFSKMHSTSLKFLLQFIYTGVVEFADLQPEILLDLLDAGERYDLAILKKACISVLIKMLENPEIAPIVMNAAKMYNFEQAVDVLSDNYLGFKFEDGVTKNVDPKLLQIFLDRSVARFYVPGADGI